MRRRFLPMLGTARSDLRPRSSIGSRVAMSPRANVFCVKPKLTDDGWEIIDWGFGAYFGGLVVAATLLTMAVGTFQIQRTYPMLGPSILVYGMFILFFLLGVWALGNSLLNIATFRVITFRNRSLVVTQWIGPLRTIRTYAPKGMVVTSHVFVFPGGTIRGADFPAIRAHALLLRLPDQAVVLSIRYHESESRADLVALPIELRSRYRGKSCTLMPIMNYFGR